MVCVYGVSNELRGAFQYFENFSIIWGMSSGRPPFLWEFTRFCEVFSKVCITFAKCQPLLTFAFAKQPSLKWSLTSEVNLAFKGTPDHLCDTWEGFLLQILGFMPHITIFELGEPLVPDIERIFNDRSVSKFSWS